MKTALALVPSANVEGWQVYADADRAPWVRDLDLAERAGLVKPRNVRATIRKCLETGVFSGAVAAGATNSALVREIEEIVPNGNRGATQTVTTYYLNREAAVLLLMRLDTPKARELQSCAVRARASRPRPSLPSPTMLNARPHAGE